MVIIDPLLRIQASDKKGSSLGSDYKQIAELKAIADEYKIAIVVVHHLRTTKSDDVFVLVSGSVGVTAAADNVILLTRERFQKHGVLSISGRDQEDQQFALEFDSDSGSWLLMGETAGIALSPERQELVDLLMKAKEPMQLKDIAESLGKEKSNISNLLKELKKQGIVEKPKTGKYILAPEFIESTKFTESIESGESPDRGPDPGEPSEIDPNQCAVSSVSSESNEPPGERIEPADSQEVDYIHPVETDEHDDSGVYPV